MMYKNKKILAFLHLIIWFLLFSMPFILSYGQVLDTNRLIAHFWIPLLFSAIIFYFNYFVLIDTLLFSKKTKLFVIVNIVIIACSLLLKESIEYNYFAEVINRRSNRNSEGGIPFRISTYLQLLSYLGPLFFSIAVKSMQRWVITEAERKEAINIKLQSELQHLHYQLQPHFFFNSLNNIYALVDISPEKAKSSIHGLSKLMRYLLYETNVELVPLSKEIEFLIKYIELMKLRVSDKTIVNYDFVSEETNIKIAPLLFISLIENAFKHGVSASKESRIEIRMFNDDKTVEFLIENNNFPKRTEDKSGSGIGLQNLEKRLQLLYPNKHEFSTTLKDERFIVHLKIETS